MPWYLEEKRQTVEPLFSHLDILTERLLAKEEYVPSQIESQESFLKRRRLAIKESLVRTFTQAFDGYKKISSEPLAIKAFDPNKPFLLYEAMGLSKDKLRDFYKQAEVLFQQKLYADAIEVFSFLTTISPLMPEFWKALSAAYLADNKENEAKDAERIATYLQG